MKRWRWLSSKWSSVKDHLRGVRAYFTTPMLMPPPAATLAPPPVATAKPEEDMTDILQAVEGAAVTLWDKIKAWIGGEVQTVSVVLSADEQALLSLFQPLLASAEASALQDLLTFIRGVLTTTPAQSSLDAWETIILQGLEKLGGELATLAKSLGSNVLQGLIAFTLAALPKSA